MFFFFLKQRWARGHLAYQCFMDEKSSRWSYRVLYEPVVYGGCFSTTSKRVQHPNSIAPVWSRCWYTPEHPLLLRTVRGAAHWPCVMREGGGSSWLVLVCDAQNILFTKNTHTQRLVECVDLHYQTQGFSWQSKTVKKGQKTIRNYIRERADRNSSTGITSISWWSADRNLFLTAILDGLRLTSQTQNLVVKPSGIKT
jgi:hypothetical protein